MPSLTDLTSTFHAALPYLPSSAHLLLSALAPIYAGAHASLSRPSSARKPPKAQHATEKEHRMEALAPSDALVFPLMAGATLTVLYLLLKAGAVVWLNRLLGAYMGLMAVAGVGKMGNDAVRVLGGFVWPDLYADAGAVWRVRQDKRVVEGPRGKKRTQPLPGLLGRIQLGEGVAAALWNVRGWLGSEFSLGVTLRGKTAKTDVSLRAAGATVVSTLVVAYAYFISTPWYLTNLQGFAMVYSALQIMSTGTFGTGSLVLIALFFYDIYFVFYTPLMVSVATQLDVPIKLLIPRPEKDGMMGLSMLGLGDIVLPGIMMALSLRFDLYMDYVRKQTKDRGAEVVKAPYVPVSTCWGERIWTLGHSSDKSVVREFASFKKTYFYASVVGYIIGMTTTLIIMHAYKHAQPALLYLVPGVLGAIWLTALARGETRLMWEYSEVEDEEEEKKKVDAKTKVDNKGAKNETKDDKAEGIVPWLKAFFSQSILGDAKMERSSDNLEDYIGRKVKITDSSKGSATSKRPWFRISIARAAADPKEKKATPKDETDDQGAATDIEEPVVQTRSTRATRRRKA